ncbi:MAG: tetratricopeptide repeat protein, partial [Mesorhizobium sp.]
MNAITVERGTAFRGFALTAALLSGLMLAACQTAPTGEFNSIDKAQGSSENISSLSAVIQRNPQDPEGYNVRGSAYGRGGQYQAALKDFNQAIQLNPNFYQAYSNRALIQRFLGNQEAALADYNRSIQINANYDAAYIGRGNLYRKAGRTQDAFN